jgi:hypothetical protein
MGAWLQMTRKKIEIIKSLGKDTDKLTVQKSLPLFALWQSDLTLSEFKILDTYLSRIDSHKPEKRTVIFEKGELEKLLGVQKINNRDLKDRLKHLMGSVVEIPDDEEKKGFRLVTLFEEATAEQDNYDMWQVKLECTQKAMKYFFNIENLGYLRYKLRCITSLTSRYTYIMFIYLEHNRYRKSWEVPLEELKEILACDTEGSYKGFKEFNRSILKRVQKEMHEKTECRYIYEPIKKGRSVVAIRFTIKTLPKTIDPTPEELPEEVEGKELWMIVLDQYDFTAEQLELLKSVLVCVPSSKLPEDNATGMNDIDIRLCSYMQIKVAELNQRSNIKNKFNYLLKMVKQDANIN